MSSSDIAIAARGVSKAYTIAHNVERATTMAEAMMRKLRHPFRETQTETFWALKDVGFEIKRGEVVGVIGRNGAGKSTLLKILSRITEPTRGEIDLYGRVGSLLEVGTGFHPELTGRENIYLNGAILGMSRREITRKFDEIVDFAEVEKFLDTPVKRYSSGMYVRLAFAVAAHLEPEILIVDEVLAVGDAAFQKKCLGKMGEVAKQGRTILFVSHNMAAINDLTTLAIYLKQGRLMTFADTESVIEAYHEDSLRAAKQEGRGLDYYRRNHVKDSPVKLQSVTVNGQPQELPEVQMQDDVHIAVRMEVNSVVTGANMTLNLRKADGTLVTTVFSWDQDFRLDLQSGTNEIVLKIPALSLAPGCYYCDIGINQSTSTPAYDVIVDYPLFDVINEGRVLHWPERPWGSVHLHDVAWSKN